MPTGIKIKEIRKQQGLTQKELGNLCGIADSNIRKYESGKQNPKLETLKRIADALNVSIYELDESLGSKLKEHSLKYHSSNSVIAILELMGYKIYQIPCMFNDGDWKVDVYRDSPSDFPTTMYARNEKLSCYTFGCKDYKNNPHYCPSCNRWELTEFIFKRDKKTIRLTIEEMKNLCNHICEYIDFMFSKQT